MKNEVSENQDRVPSGFFAKEQRARDAASALEAYRAERRAVDENTARLRALRLARDAAAKDAKPKPAKKATKKARRIAV